MRIAYLDCFSGISGNMLLGAFLDAGLSEYFLHETLNRLGMSGFQLNISRIKKSGLQATLVEVKIQNAGTHRHLKDIEATLTAGSLPDPVLQQSTAVFRRLAEAEAAVHGCAIEEVHFHEVGAVDAIVDIVGSVSAFHELGISRLVCSPLPLSRGWVRCAHGELPLPAPAVCKLLKGVPVYGENSNQELVTPTGAALICELADAFGEQPPMLFGETGYGAGTMQRKDGRPNLVRLIIGEEHHPDEAQRILVLETSLDDWNPEIWPYILEKLLQAGALDVTLIPVHTKKGRPGFILKVICDPSHKAALQDLIFRETTAIGLRYHHEDRITLPREIITIPTPWGDLKAKKIMTTAGEVITPEYEECRKMAQENNIPIQRVYQEVNKQPEK